MTDGWSGNSEIHTPLIACQPSLPVPLVWHTFWYEKPGLGMFGASWLVLGRGWENAWVFSKWRKCNFIVNFVLPMKLDWGSPCPGLRPKSSKWALLIPLTGTSSIPSSPPRSHWQGQYSFGPWREQNGDYTSWQLEWNLRSLDLTDLKSFKSSK